MSKEKLLFKHLDSIYIEIFKSSRFSITRNQDINLQHLGVDLILSDGVKKIYVDEKAQLDYLNHSLPTFAFEISYLKKKLWHKGWLMDKHKLTNIYFLITSIYTKQNDNLKSGLKHIKLTGIYRDKLIKLLFSKGLSESKLYDIEKKIRTKGNHGKINLDGLNPSTEGYIYFSKNNKNEQPINLVLKLKFLTNNFTGKTLFRL